MSSETTKPATQATRQKLLNAATELMLQHGFSATTVDRICEVAGVTKGAFFHYFKSKEEIATAAVGEWRRCGTEMYLGYIGDPGDDPLVRLNRLFDGMIGMAERPAEPLVCLLGMMAQELADAHDGMRETCSDGLDTWTAMVATLLDDARKIHPVRVDFDPGEIGWMLNSLWQGAMLVAKTRRDPDVIANSLRHARAYIDGLFLEPQPKAKKPVMS